MATVFLAEDLRHHRQVAVKVLMPDLGHEQGSARFLREIEIAARLTHPHILPLHDSGDADGLLFYVMPHVPGESLRHRMTAIGPLPIDEAVRIAKQVASALDYAHRNGVVHRDIKPENILLHEGSALVADFGIAYALSAAEGARLTGTGFSLGTLAYMSPEQATGDRLVDARSDIYALGCVLYEMLSGDPPFAGHSSQAVIARILSDTAVGLRALRPTVPENVEAAVRKAMARMPVDRFATAADFEHALEAPAPARAGALRPTRRVLLTVAAAAGLIAVTAVIVTLAKSRPAPPAVERHERQLTFSGDARDVALTPDGRSVAYVIDGRRKLVVRDVDGGLEAVVASDPGGLALPSWSRDGSRLLYRSESRLSWFEIGREGGPATLVAGTNLNLGFCRAGPWRFCGGYQGYIYLGDAPSTVHPVGNDSITGVGRILRLAPQVTFIESLDPQPSPDGNWIAAVGSAPGGDVVLALIDSSGARAQILDRGLLRGGSGTTEWTGLGTRWSADGSNVYYGKSRGPGWSLWAVAINPRTGAARGPPRMVLDHLPGRFWYDVSLDGHRLVYSGGPGEAGLYRIALGGSREARALAEGALSHTGAQVSPDERSVAYVREQSDGSTDVFTMDLDGGQERAVTNDATQKLLPAWSPDGRRLAYLAFHDSAFAIEIAEAGGAGTPRRLRTAAAISAGGRPTWTPDGRALLYMRAGNRNWGVLDLATGTERVLLHDDTLGWSFAPLFSPDGGLVAMYRHTPPRQHLWLVDPLTGAARETPVDMSQSELLRWGADGQVYIGYMGNGSAIRRIDRMGPDRARAVRLAAIDTPCEGWIGADLAVRRGIVVCSVYPHRVDVWVVDGFVAPATR